MHKITGVKSVDFKIIAKGHGVVNWNGSTSLNGGEGTTVDNHMLPKLRGYSSLSGKVKAESGYLYRKEAQDIDFRKTPMYVSQNCIRHHLFKDQNYDLHFSTRANMDQVLASVTGLLRGFVIPLTQWKKTSPLLIEDFVDQLHNGNFEQFSTDRPMELQTEKNKKTTKGDTDDHAETASSGEPVYKRGSDTLFSKTTFGDTEYLAYGSISIEDLQFISLDPKFDRCAMAIKTGQGEIIAQQITDFLQEISDDETLKPLATFGVNYCRIGTIFNQGEVGILLNDDAIHVLVKEMLRRLEGLFIKQAKGYLYVDDIEVDYNSSNKPMRIKKGGFSVVSEKDGLYAKYFEVR